jgi:hypothetical protein
VLRQSGGWPPLTSAAVPVTLPSRVMVCGKALSECRRRSHVIMPLPDALIPFLAHCHHWLLTRRLLLAAIDRFGKHYVVLMKPA